MNTSLESEEDVVAVVRQVLNEIHDPCGLAQGTSIGLVDMGLLKDLRVQAIERGWSVFLLIRFTSPACLYFDYFEIEIRKRLKAFPGIEEVHIEYDKEFDWTPDDLAESAKAKLKERREEYVRIANKQARSNG